MNFCPNCGSKLEPGVSYCHNCGNKVNTTQNANTNSQSGNKSKLVSCILGIFLGSLGIHNFYLGYTGKAVAQLLMFVFWLGFFSFIWGIIDTIRIFIGNISTDADGNYLVDNI